MSAAARIWRRGRTAACLLACLAAPACDRATPDRAVLNAWLTCVECSDGELAAVETLAANVPSTVDTLRAALLQGPSAAQRGRLSQQLQATYQRLADHVAGSPLPDSLPVSQPVYVGRYLGNMVAIYQGRAALALGAIGGTRARQALTDALALPAGSFPPSVRARIQFAYDSLLGP